ncbi:TonB-dependent receptor [Sphingobium lactosutens]|uniref:TonB-dependent receptor n=1 Tax=Sphingobium lactosutens TaxID=522773 RepID=UPI00041200DA|nr:TonB-dependent receptor [Sphingobium lactosutens]
MKAQMIGVSTLAVLTAMPLAAIAQDSAPADDGLAEIVVTAQRKAETAQKAALAIAVIQPEAMANVLRPADLTTLAPALQISTASGASPIIFLRGVGTQTSNPYTDSAIAVNYDGVYIGRPTSTSGFFYDLERVEVLKGPQGTLYGRNATGGAINILPEKPHLGEFGIKGAVSYGNYDAYNAQLAVNIPVSDKVALRISGSAFGHDGYATDGTYDDKGRAIRAQLLIAPTDDVKIRLSADYFDQGGSGPNSVIVARNVPGTGLVPTGFDADVGLFDPRSVAIQKQSFFPPAGTVIGPFPQRPFNDNQYWGFSGELVKRFGDTELTMLASLRKADLNLLSVSPGFAITTDERDQQLSFETRLAGRIGAIDWLLGAFYFGEQVDATFGVNQKVFGGFQSLSQDTQSYAGFSKVTVNLSDIFRLTGAARYTKDEKTFRGALNSVQGICLSPSGCPNFDYFPSGYFPDVDTAMRAIGFIRPPGSPVYIDPTNTKPVIWSPGSVVINDRTAPSKLTYRIAAEFEPRDQSLLYASFETGYRAGGFSFSSVNPVYQPESIDAWTIGSKNRFLNNHLQVNLELFLWKYKDQQVAHASIGATGGQEFITENIGSSINKGFEVEVTARPLHNTTLNVNIQYLDAKYKNFVYSEFDTSSLARLPAGSIPPNVQCPYVVAPGTGTYTVDCSGKTALRSPKVDHQPWCAANRSSLR